MMYGNDHGGWAKAENATAKIEVWLDMNDCPIPEGYDATWVRPSIEAEFKKLGYVGPVSITAYGDQNKNPNHILRGLSSTGVTVVHTIFENTCSGIFGDMLKWRGENPPPSTMMFISDHVEHALRYDRDQGKYLTKKYKHDMGWDLTRLQQETKYNLFVAYSVRSQLVSGLQNSGRWLWKELLDNKPEEIINSSELLSTGQFYCKRCRFVCQNVNNFRKHLLSSKHALEEDNPGNGDLDPITRTWAKNYAAKPEYATAKIAVWWDMNNCPIPEGYDARWVRPSLEAEFKKLGYYGPVSITAYGVHTKTPDHLLRGLSSTGVTIANSIPGRIISNMYNDLEKWRSRNPPPATTMLISDQVEDYDTFVALLQQEMKYNLFLGYSFRPNKMSLLVTSAEWPWDSLLGVSEPTRYLHLQECSEKGDSTGMFYCKLCDSQLNSRSYESLDDFRKHLSTEKHAMIMDEIYHQHQRIENERREYRLDKILKTKSRSRKVSRKSFRLLHEHLRLTNHGVRPRARTFKKRCEIVT